MIILALTPCCTALNPQYLAPEEAVADTDSGSGSGSGSGSEAGSGIGTEPSTTTGETDGVASGATTGAWSDSGTESDTGLATSDASDAETGTTTGEPFCGDGNVDVGEQCDDGNAVDADGCESSCVRTIQDVVAGGEHTCVLLAKGQVRCWGKATFGQLGLAQVEPVGDDEHPNSADDVDLGGYAVGLAAGGDHTCAVLDSGLVRCWGHNDDGQLGQGNGLMIGAVDSPGDVGAIQLGGALAVQVSAGYRHTCALTDEGEVMCWGGNSNGQLGYGHASSIGDDPGEMPPPIVALGDLAVRVVAGREHTCALTASSTVRCWGHGAGGVLGSGDGDAGDVGDEPGEMPPAELELDGDVLDITTGPGGTHTCALMSTGGVRCWGGLLGQAKLGYGSSEDIGDDESPGDAGDVALGGAALRVSAGDGHTCAVRSGAVLLCWGTGGSGALGSGSPADVGDQPGEMPPAPVNAGGKSVRVAAGDQHTCALMAGGAVRCWGRNNYGQLGYGSSVAMIGSAPGQMPTPPVAVF